MADTLLSEVDADVRAEKLARAWAQWRAPLAVFCAALVLGTAGSQWWHHHRELQGGQWLLQLSQGQSLLEKNHAGDAARVFAAVEKDASGNAKNVATIWRSRALAAEGKTDEAAASLEKLATNKADVWSDIACLRLVALKPEETDCLQSRATSPLAEQRAAWKAAMAGEKRE